MATEDDNTSKNHLPIEIVENILLILPVKSLLRFKSVSKLWNTLISDPVFVRNHPRSSSDSPNLFLPNYRSIEGFFSLVKLKGREFHKQASFRGPYDRLRVLCYCKGLLLLTCFYMDGVNPKHVLWNPSTGMEKSIYYPFRPCNSMTYGVCYDHTNEDCKVVISSRDSSYEVFSCKNNSWTSKPGFPYQRTGSGSGSGISVDGEIYWVLSYGNDETRQVVYFDSKTDEIKRLRKPDQISDDDLFFLVCLRGSLCLYYKTRVSNTVQIWIKEKGVFENCWKELITIENLEMPIHSIEPLCFVGNKIVIRLESTRFVYYNPCEKTFEEFEDRYLISLSLVPYVDSLFFPVVKLDRKRKRSYRKRKRTSALTC